MSIKELTSTGKRKPPNAGKGRPKGSLNKVTSDVKAMVLTALNDAGGARYLLTQAKTNPNAFLALVGKVLPLTLAGDPSAPLVGLTDEQINAKLAAFGVKVDG